LIQPFQQEERVIGFFGNYRDLYPVSRDVLRDIATQFQNCAALSSTPVWGSLSSSSSQFTSATAKPIAPDSSSLSVL